MDIYLPVLSDYDDPQSWTFALGLNCSVGLRLCREQGDKAGRETLLRHLRACVKQAVKLKITDPGPVHLLARNTTKPKERLRLYSIAYEYQMTDLIEEADFDEQARERVVAAEMQREMGLIHEAQGNAAKAADCFTRALAHLQEASDLFETYCLSGDSDNSEGETFPLRPRLVTELERVRKRMGESAG